MDEKLYDRKDNTHLRPPNMQPVGVKSPFRNGNGSMSKMNKTMLTTAES